MLQNVSVYIKSEMTEEIHGLVSYYPDLSCTYIKEKNVLNNIHSDSLYYSQSKSVCWLAVLYFCIVRSKARRGMFILTDISVRFPIEFKNSCTRGVLVSNLLLH